MSVSISDSPTRVIVNADSVSIVSVGLQGPSGVAGGGIGLSAGTTSITTGTAILSNSNNVSFGMNNGTVTASASYPAQTQFQLSNSNGISFGTNGSTVTASYTVPTQSVQPGIQSVSGGTTRVTTGEVVFSNSNNVSFGIAGNTVTGSASFSQSVQTQSNVQGISAGTQVGRTGDIVFSNSNGASFGMAGSNTITMSYTVPTVTNSSMTVSDSATSGTIGRLAFTNLNGVTLSLSTGAGGSHTIVGSHNALTSQSNQAFSAAGGSSAFQTLSFENANGATFSNNGGAVQLSYTVPTQTNQTIGVYGSSQTTGQSSSSTVDARSLTFRGAGNVSVGLSGGEVIISATGGGAGGGIAAAAGTQTATSGTVNFANSNGATFGMSGSSRITLSYTVPSTAGLISALNVSAGTTSQNLSGVTFSNSNGLSFGLNAANGVVTGSVVVPAASLNFSAGTTSQNLSAVTFNNANGITFGLNAANGSITASHNGLTSQSNQAFSAAGGSSAFQTLSFGNSNGLTFSNSNGSVIASYTVPSTAGLLSNINLSAGTTSSNLSAFVASNSNNVTFGLNGATLTASASFAAQTNQTLGLYASSQTTGQSSSSTVDARSLTVRGAGIVSVGYSGGELVISGVAAGAGDGGNVLAAGTQTAVSNGSVKFADSNGITFGMSNSSQITASYTVPSTAGLLSAINLSAGTTSNNLSAITFSNSNGLSFGLNGSVVTGSYTVPTVTNSSLSLSDGATSMTIGRLAFTNANGITLTLSTTTGGSATLVGSHNALTSQSNQAFSASGGSSAFQTLNFANSNGLTFSNSNGSVIASYTVPSTAGLISAINISAGTTSNNLSAVTFSNSNNVSFGLNGSVITATVTTPAQTNQTLGIYGSSQTTGQSSSSTYDARSLTFRGAGIVSVGNSGGEIIISATGGGAADGGVGISAGANSVSNGTVVFSNSNGISFGLNASTVTASYTVPTQSNQSIGIYAVSNTTGASSSSTVDARSLSFQGAGIASVGMTNGSVVISVPAGGGAGDGYNILAAGTQTANTTGTVVFSNSNNVTFGMSNSSVITASADAGSVNFLEVGAPVAFGQITHSTLWLQRINQPYRMTATVADILLAVSNSASAGWTGSVSFGIYGIDASTLNMLSSSTRTIGYNSTAAASSYTAMSATRFLSIPVSFQMTPGQYVLGMIWDTVSSATSGSHSFAVNRSLITVQQEPFAGGNRTRGFAHGVFTAATGAFPSTIHLTNIAQSSNVALRQPYVMLAGTF